MTDRRIYACREDPTRPGRFEILRHRRVVGRVEFEIPFGDPAIRAAVRLMVEDAVRLWDNAAKGDDLWVSTEEVDP